MSDTTFVIEPGKQDILMTRVFDAPRDTVFKALTDPTLIPSWWGPRDLETVVDRCDIRTGGAWRYVHRDAQGDESAFHGVYHEVTAPDRIVSTFEFEGVPGHVVLETTTLEDLDGKTRYVNWSVFQSVEDRDGMVASGMESGARDTVDRLAEVIRTLQ
ncbi:MAG: SRPBCC family protein [Sporichthyaceae bacterium]|nr:SRPBCC family protein [Sporichthyaceae bacterium]